jgi:hypothetical protein
MQVFDEPGDQREAVKARRAAGQMLEQGGGGQPRGRLARKRCLQDRDVELVDGLSTA